jgi:hypothetical protein
VLECSWAFIAEEDGLTSWTTNDEQDFGTLTQISQVKLFSFPASDPARIVTLSSYYHEGENLALLYNNNTLSNGTVDETLPNALPWELQQHISFLSSINPIDVAMDIGTVQGDSRYQLVLDGTSKKIFNFLDGTVFTDYFSSPACQDGSCGDPTCFVPWFRKALIAVGTSTGRIYMFRGSTNPTAELVTSKNDGSSIIDVSFDDQGRLFFLDMFNGFGRLSVLKPDNTSNPQTWTHDPLVSAPADPWLQTPVSLYAHNPNDWSPVYLKETPEYLHVFIVDSKGNVDGRGTMYIYYPDGYCGDGYCNVEWIDESYCTCSQDCQARCTSSRNVCPADGSTPAGCGCDCSAGLTAMCTCMSETQGYSEAHFLSASLWLISLIPAVLLGM